MMIVYLGADHRGFELKSQIQEWLTNRQLTFEDFGAFSYDPEDDLNEPAIAVAKAIQSNPEGRGILLCGSSYGVCIQANRFKGVRAISGFTPELAQHARTNDDANVLCLDADTKSDNYEAIIDTFLATEFLATDNYIRRRQKLDEAN